MDCSRYIVLCLFMLRYSIHTSIYYSEIGNVGCTKIVLLLLLSYDVSF